MMRFNFRAEDLHPAEDGGKGLQVREVAVRFDVESLDDAASKAVGGVLAARFHDGCSRGSDCDWLAVF